MMRFINSKGISMRKDPTMSQAPPFRYSVDLHHYEFGVVKEIVGLG